MIGDLQRRIDAVLTAFRSDGGVTPEGYIGDDKLDTPNGDFAQWCLRNQWVLERHGLYMEHPTSTVQRGAPARCHLQMDAGANPGRVYFSDVATAAAPAKVVVTEVPPTAAPQTEPLSEEAPAPAVATSTAAKTESKAEPSDGYNGHIA